MLYCLFCDVSFWGVADFKIYIFKTFWRNFSLRQVAGSAVN